MGIRFLLNKIKIIKNKKIIREYEGILKEYLSNLDKRPGVLKILNDLK